MAAVNGVATFSNLLLDTAGTYTLSAAGWFAHRCHQRQHRGHCGRASSSVFEMSREWDGRHALSPAVTVEVEDPNGNVARGTPRR